MPINKKFMVIAGFAGVVAISIAASMPQQQEPPKPKNLKVLPKDIPFRTLDHIMDTWAVSLGVHCNFCHARDPQTNKMDFASDAKPEKTTARHMFKMAAKINKKFFEGQKDSLGMVVGSVNCYTCHRGSAHPEVKLPERQRGPGGPPPGGNPPPPGSNPPGQ